MSEFFVALALPVSAQAGADAHVNVFISPKLSSPTADATLADFALFKEWGTVAKDGLKLTLVDQNGPMDATMDVSAIEAALWSRAFPASTPVRENPVPQWQQRDWRTFPAKDVAETAKAIHLATVAADPTTPVKPSAHPFMRPIFDYVLKNKALQLPARGNRLDWPVYDESVLTRLLDARLPRGPKGAQTLASPVGAYGYGVLSAAASAAAVQAALQDLHRVRRFYERPESQAAKQAVPVPPKKVQPLEPPKPEFHERVAAAGDHRELLLKLGLVIPLKGDPARLLKSQWLAVHAELPVPPASHASNVCRSPPVAVMALADGTLVTRPDSDGPQIWQEGKLALGESSVFDVVDVEIDGSAIKAERFLTTLPRLALTELRDEPVDAATPALRASGLTVTRRQQAGRAISQLGRQESLAQILATPVAPSQLQPLHTADVTRGLRVEVWDQTAKRWASLHARDTSLRIDGTVVYQAQRNEGFIQGSNATQTPGVADSAIHVHEAMFGWDGWSLSAPRPGRRVRAVVGDAPGGGSSLEERVEDASQERPTGQEPHPFQFTHTIAKGTLPRLRYGREYAFRAWNVDLTGATRPHSLAPSPVRPAGVATLLSSAKIGQTLNEQIARDHFGGIGSVHEALHLGVGAQEKLGPLVVLESTSTDASANTERENPPVANANASARLLNEIGPDALRKVAAAARLGGVAEASADRKQTQDLLRTTIAGQVAKTRASADAVQFAAARSTLVGQVFRSAVTDRKTPLTRSTLVTDATRIADLIAAQIDAAQAGSAAEPTPAAVAKALKTVTALRPFLRWDPIPPPVAVPLKAYTEAESQRVLVVRSGVAQNPATLEITVTSPADYAAAVNPTKPGAVYTETSQRHLAPPKTSQVQAELHGVFDAGIDAGGAAAVQARKEMLAIALREDGSFFDQQVPHPTDPSGAPTPQPGVRLLPEPDGDDHHNPHDPARLLKVLPPGPPGTAEELVLKKGDAPAPGQYVVHDTQQLTLPYLPDPLARGVSLVFHEAGAGRTIEFPWGTEGVTADYQGAWPRLQSFLLTLHGGQTLGGAIADHRIDITLPPGDLQRFRLSSALPKQKLHWLGVWRSLADSITSQPVASEAAADGLLWGLSPSESVMLVHAVPRPVLAPRPTTVNLIRAPGSTLAAMFGGLEVHGASTDSVSADASWRDLVDDTSLPEPVHRDATLAAFTTKVLAHEQILPLWIADQALSIAGWEGVQMHSTVHTFPDTKHHRVRYRFRATTRFREYFAPQLLASDPSNPLDDGMSVVSAELEIKVPSTVAPEPPLVDSVLPLFRWSDSEEPEQPFARRRTRGVGVRIYLKRPWNSSGDGELLAVLLTPGASDTTDYPPSPNPAEGFAFVSQWGSDPVWVGPQVQKRPLRLVDFDDGLSLAGFDDRKIAGYPAAAPATLPLPLPPKMVLPGQPNTVPVVALGYEPQFSRERGLWYVDIALSPRATFWPFVRLALARYQPESVGGKHLSTPVRADFVQLAPERSASVSRTDDRHVRVVVAGYTGSRTRSSRVWAAGVAENRVVIARLQEFDPTIGGDLGWTTREVVELQIHGHGATPQESVWVGELTSPQAIALRTPPLQDSAPTSPRFRVRVEEWERFPGDRPPNSEVGPNARDPVWQSRLVYADDLWL